jgi:hypothetical protein
MNINDVSKREILDFDQFRKKVHDENFKPFSEENQTSTEGRSGLHKIKREPAYDWVGYADAVFSPEKAGIQVPGYNAFGERNYINGVGSTNIDPGMRATMDTSENESYEFFISRLNEFDSNKF